MELRGRVLDFDDLGDIGQALVPKDGVDRVAEPSDNEEADDEEEEEEKFCSTCGRSSTCGRQIANQEETLGWGLPELRGSACDECLNTWRLHLRDSEVPLSTLPVHMRDINKKFNFREKVAWASIRLEGKKRVNGHELRKRVESVTWILKQMGLPVGPWVVKTIGEHDPLPSDPFTLATLQDEGQYRLVHFAPAIVDPGQVLDRPLGKLPLYLGGAPLVTDVAAEAALLAGKSFAPADEAALAIADGFDADTASLKADQADDKLSRYLQVIESKVFCEFRNSTWVEVCLESTLSAILTKLVPMRQDCALLEDDDEKLEKLDDVMTGVGHGKQFLRNVRFGKKATKLSLEKALYLEPHCSKFLQFLSTYTSVEPCPTFRLIAARNCFLETYRTTLDVPQALDSLDCCGFVEMLLGEEVWVRTKQQQKSHDVRGLAPQSGVHVPCPSVRAMGRARCCK